MNAYLETLGSRAKAAQLNKTSEKERSAALLAAADRLERSAEEILAANAEDVKRAEEKGVSAPMVDRLRLSGARIADIAAGLRQVAGLSSPVGETIYAYRKENGLLIEEKRVPFGVIGIIFESRPNVAADAFGLCFKTANAVILRGGSDAISSNAAVVNALRGALAEVGMDENAVQLIEDTSRETAAEFMKMKKYLDLLIPRGGAGLIRSVTENASVPVIETGTGNCHIYVHESADFDKAFNIIVNAKTQRVGVCNAAESLLVDRAVADRFLPVVVAVLHDHGVLIHGDESTCTACADAGLAEGDDYVAATEEDWGREYLALEMSVKVVANEDEAIAHINRYGTMHSEAIVAEDADVCERFLDAVDASAVYANASTRFTDGGEFGLGAEIGISTQKLHARGPFAAEALTTYKYKLRGTGQVRP